MFKRKPAIQKRKLLRSKTEHAPAKDTKMRDLLIASAIGVMGAMIGSYVTANIQYQNEQRKQQAQQLREGFNLRTYTDNNDADVSMFLDAMKSLSSVSDEHLRNMAALRRKYPDCYSNENFFLTRCKPYVIGVIAVNRQEAGVGAVPPEDIEAAMESKYSAAKQATQRVLNKTIP